MDIQASAASGASPFGASTLPSGIPLRREDVARADEADSDRVYRNVEIMSYASSAFVPMSSRDAPMVGGPVLMRSYDDASLKSGLAVAPSKPGQIVLQVAPSNNINAPKLASFSSAPRSLVLSLGAEASARGVEAFLAAPTQSGRMHARGKAEGESARVWLGYVLCESSQLTEFRLRLSSPSSFAGSSSSFSLLEVIRERGSDTDCLDMILAGLRDHFGAQTASYPNGGAAPASSGLRRCCPPPVSAEEEEGEEDWCRSAGIAALSDLLRGTPEEALQCIGQMSYNKNRVVLESENLLADVSRFLQARTSPDAGAVVSSSNSTGVMVSLACSCLRNMLSGIGATGVPNGLLRDEELVAALRGALLAVDGRADACARSEARKALDQLSAAVVRLSK